MKVTIRDSLERKIVDEEADEMAGWCFNDSLYLDRETLSEKETMKDLQDFCKKHHLNYPLTV